MTDETAMVEVRELTVKFGGFAALDSISTTIGRGRTVGLVGESGSGKSTLAKMLVGLLRATSGEVVIGGTSDRTASRSQRTAARRRVQMIPQDPYSSLDPRRTIGQTLAEAVDPRRASVAKHTDEIVHWLESVRLPADTIARYPHEFSGGQRQRIAIARALITKPDFVIADEITSALDVSVQAEVLSLIAGLREQLGLTMLFISHDLAVVRDVSDELVVMRAGQIVEQGAAASIYDEPQHPYTRLLLDSVPGSPGFSLAR
jgi:ABC-type oligopeptide transport system ATPase subunit